MFHIGLMNRCIDGMLQTGYHKVYLPHQYSGQRTSSTLYRSCARSTQTTLGAMSYPADPVNPSPATPLIHGYSYHSALPEGLTSDEGDAKEPWIMGIDEAGRGRT